MAVGANRNTCYGVLFAILYRQYILVFISYYPYNLKHTMHTALILNMHSLTSTHLLHTDTVNVTQVHHPSSTWIIGEVGGCMDMLNTCMYYMPCVYVYAPCI